MHPQEFVQQTQHINSTTDHETLRQAFARNRKAALNCRTRAAHYIVSGQTGAALDCAKEFHQFNKLAGLCESRMFDMEYACYTEAIEVYGDAKKRNHKSPVTVG